MPPRKLLRAFLGLWAVTGLVLFVGSVDTVREAVVGRPHPHLAILGSVEAMAAVLFLVPRTMRLGALGLGIALGLALGLHAAVGEFRSDLLVYGAAVSFVAIHRPLRPDQLRAALGRVDV